MNSIRIHSCGTHGKLEFTCSIRCFSFQRKIGCQCASSMFSPSKCVQYVNDACGCHEVPRLPFKYCQKVSCMQMDGVELCTKRGSNCSVWQSCLSLPVQIFSLFSYSIYIQILKEKNQSVKQPYSDSASSNTIVLCNSGSVCNAMH